MANKDSNIKGSKIKGNCTETECNKVSEVQSSLKANIKNIFQDKLTPVEDLRWEYGLSFSVDAENLFGVMETLRNHDDFKFEMLAELTAIDWLDEKDKRFEVIYHLMSVEHMHRLCIRVALEEGSEKVASVVQLWPGANFMEREAWDMYGITFEGHGDLRRILMYDEFVGHPLRKDYPKGKKQPRVKLRVPELRNDSNDMKREQLVSLPTRQRITPENVK